MVIADLLSTRVTFLNLVHPKYEQTLKGKKKKERKVGENN